MNEPIPTDPGDSAARGGPERASVGMAFTVPDGFELSGPTAINPCGYIAFRLTRTRPDGYVQKTDVAIDTKRRLSHAEIQRQIDNGVEWMLHPGM